jgi:hypothetical protein
MPAYDPPLDPDDVTELGEMLGFLHDWFSGPDTEQLAALLHPQIVRSRLRGLALLTQLHEAPLPPPVRRRATDPCHLLGGLEGVPAKERSPEGVLGRLANGQVMPPLAR